MKSCFFETTGAISASTALATCGFTARMTTSAPATAFWLSVSVLMPHCLRSAAKAASSRREATMFLGDVSLPRTMPPMRARPMWPAPMTAIRLLFNIRCAKQNPNPRSAVRVAWIVKLRPLLYNRLTSGCQGARRKERLDLLFKAGELIFTRFIHDRRV